MFGYLVHFYVYAEKFLIMILRKQIAVIAFLPTSCLTVRIKGSKIEKILGLGQGHPK